MDRTDIKTAESLDLTDVAAPFEILTSLPFSLCRTQCVSYKDEILMFGGHLKRDCYSYHTIKNQYKIICSYPKNVELHAHCVVKLMNNNPNEINILSFGGSEFSKRHTLKMKYVSVWNDNKEIGIKSEKKNRVNEWIPFTDNKDIPYLIGRNQDDHRGARAVIGGNNNNLLFITYYPEDIDVFDLNTCQFIKHDKLPIENWIRCHCFIIKTENNLSIIKTKKKKHELMFFSQSNGLSIEYDEENNIFQFHKVRVCTSIKSFVFYGYVYINDVILFFGGHDNAEVGATREIHKYSTTQNKWTKSEHILPIALSDYVALLSEDNVYIHILGENDGKKDTGTYMKTRLTEWIQEETEIERQWITEEEEKIKIEEIKIELEKIKDVNIEKWKKKKEIEMIIEYWAHSLFINVGWIQDFNIIILNYIL
ncbi:hypothetical protein RFI_28779, partial [Reticulomyxa filosa]